MGFGPCSPARPPVCLPACLPVSCTRLQNEAQRQIEQEILIPKASIAAPLLTNPVILLLGQPGFYGWFSVSSMEGNEFEKTGWGDGRQPQSLCFGLIIFWQLCNCIYHPLSHLCYHTHVIKYGNALNWLPPHPFNHSPRQCIHVSKPIFWKSPSHPQTHIAQGEKWERREREK